MTNLYDVLGIPSDASYIEVKRAYRAWMQIHHPDVNGGKKHPDHDDVQMAYEVLMDGEARARYDETGETIVPPEMIAARGLVLSWLAQLMASPHVLEMDINVRLQTRANNERAESLQAKRLMLQEVRKLERLKARIEVKGAALFVHEGIDQALEAAKREIEAGARYRRELDAVEEIVADMSMAGEAELLPLEAGEQA